MISQALYHCACHTSTSSQQDEFNCAPDTVDEYHPLASLYFCEECDAIRCPRCVTSEVNIYYCPLCQFEVPSASVRAEQHTCARNCFLCPSCNHTCSVGATEPPPGSTSAGDPPYWLWCQACKWDSKQIGITFDRPTGLAQQMQKVDSIDPAATEFDRLRDHMEPFLKAGLAIQAGTPGPGTTAPGTASKGLSSLPSRYGSLMNLAGYTRSRSHPHLQPPTIKDEPSIYVPALSSSSKAEEEAAKVAFMQKLESMDEVASFSKRANKAWNQELRQSALKPCRVPLQAKRTKRCPTCKHILVKPESKSNSIKYRIKLVAANYLPSIQLFRRSPAIATGSRLSAAGAASTRRAGRAGVTVQAPSSSILAPPELDEPMRSGRNYSFELAFVNPLYEAITVEVIALKTNQSLDSLGSPTGDEGSMLSSDFNIGLPSCRFPIAAFAEQWEYEDAEPEDLDDLGDAGRRTSSGLSGGRRKQASGILEKKANRTTILLDLSVGKSYVGPVQIYLLVTYIYAADETETSDPRKGGGHDDHDRSAEKSFSFWTSLKLGHVQPPPVVKRQSVAAPNQPSTSVAT